MTHQAHTPSAPAAVSPASAPLLTLHHMPGPAPAAALPERYRGDPVGCCTFLLVSELYLPEYPNLTAAPKISTVIQPLSLSHPAQGQSSSQLLLQLRQGVSSAAEYAISFRILVADSGWNGPRWGDCTGHQPGPASEGEESSHRRRCSNGSTPMSDKQRGRGIRISSRAAKGQ